MLNMWQCLLQTQSVLDVTLQILTGENCCKNAIKQISVITRDSHKLQRILIPHIL